MQTEQVKHVKVCVKNRKVVMEIDSGASDSIINYEMYRDLFSRYIS